MSQTNYLVVGMVVGKDYSSHTHSRYTVDMIDLNSQKLTNILLGILIVLLIVGFYTLNDKLSDVMCNLGINLQDCGHWQGSS